MEGHISTNSLVFSGHEKPKDSRSSSKAEWGGEASAEGWSSLHSCHSAKVRMEVFPKGDQNPQK